MFKGFNNKSPQFKNFPNISFGMNANYLCDKYSIRGIAISLRRLTKSYQGPILRIRRDSDNTELDIYLSGDYINESDITNFVGLNSGYVVRWYCQNTGRYFQMTTNANQPRIVNVGTVEKTSAGFIAPYFDGSNDRLTIDTQYTYDAQNISCALVCQSTGSGMGFCNPDANRLYGAFKSAGNFYFGYQDSGTKFNLSTSNNNLNIHSIHSLGSNINAYINLTPSTQITSIAATSGQYLTIGSYWNGTVQNNQMTGYFLELILSGSLQSSSPIFDIDIKSYYGI